MPSPSSPTPSPTATTLIETGREGLDRPMLDAAIRQSMNRKSRLWLEDAVFRGTESPSFRDAVLRFDRALSGFEERFACSDWLAGPSFSIADAAYLPYMIRLDLLHLNALWRDRPRIADWFGRLKARKGFAAVMDWYEPRNLEVLTGRGRGAADAVEAVLPRRNGMMPTGYDLDMNAPETVAVQAGLRKAFRDGRRGRQGVA